MKHAHVLALAFIAPVALCAGGCAMIARYDVPAVAAGLDTVNRDAVAVNNDLTRLTADRKAAPIVPAAITSDLLALGADQATLRTDFAALAAALKAAGQPAPTPPAAPMGG